MKVAWPVVWTRPCMHPCCRLLVQSILRSLVLSRGIRSWEQRCQEAHRSAQTATMRRCSQAFAAMEGRQRRWLVPLHRPTRRATAHPSQPGTAPRPQSAIRVSVPALQPRSVTRAQAPERPGGLPTGLARLGQTGRRPTEAAPGARSATTTATPL